MNPIKFKGMNITFAEDQKEYLPLPAFIDVDAQEKTVVSCWQLTWRERIKLLFTGKLWFSQMTFGQSLQPQLPTTYCPLVFKEEDNSL